MPPWPQQSTSTSTRASTVFGIFVGMVVVLLVLWLIWPFDHDRVLSSLAEATRLMGRFIQRGLLPEEQEAEQRPLNGFRYRIAWLLSDAYQFRQEARFEQKLVPSAMAPALVMGMQLLSLNFRIHAVVQNRLEHEQVRAYGKLDEVHALLDAITQRLDAIGDLIEHGTPLPMQISRRVWPRPMKSWIRSKTCGRRICCWCGPRSATTRKSSNCCRPSRTERVERMHCSVDSESTAFSHRCGDRRWRGSDRTRW